MDPLEKFIRDNKAAFDQHEPSDDLWEDIEANLDTLDDDASEEEIIKNTTSRSITISYRTLWRVAAVALLLLSSVAVWQYVERGQQANTAVTTVPLNEIDPELADAEAYYTAQIQEKREELIAIDPDALKAFDGELHELDELYDNLKEKLLSTADQEAIATAMIENLRIRIEILNRQIEILERYQQKKQENETQYL
ncbi:MAG: hypothetical protein ACFB0B_01385 [Thermonemataceae bacterium]